MIGSFKNSGLVLFKIFTAIQSNVNDLLLIIIILPEISFIYVEQLIILGETTATYLFIHWKTSSSYSVLSLICNIFVRSSLLEILLTYFLLFRTKLNNLFQQPHDCLLHCEIYFLWIFDPD